MRSMTDVGILSRPLIVCDIFPERIMLCSYAFKTEPGWIKCICGVAKCVQNKNSGGENVRTKWNE